MALAVEERDRLLQELHDRLPAKPLSEERVAEMVAQGIKAFEGSAPEARKLLFGGGAAAELHGTKYGRFGLSLGDVEFLHEVMNAAKGQHFSGTPGVHQGPSTELEGVFKAVTEARYLPEDEVRRLDHKAIEDIFPRIRRAQIADFDAKLKAMDTAETGFGLQLIGNQYVSELWEAARMQSRLFALIPTFEMMAPTAYLPIMQAMPEMQFQAEATSPTASDYSTVKTGSNRVQVDAKKLMFHQIWSGEMEEDSIIPYIPFLRLELMNGLSHYSDALVLNGDLTNAATGNINLDDADPADTKYYLAFDGIRHAGIVDNTANSKDIAGAITDAAFRDALARMIDATNLFYWGSPNDPNDLIHVMDFETYLKCTDFSSVVTVDKMGPKATILTGQLAALWGHPLIVSAAMSKTEADGKVSTTGSNNTKGQVASFNRRGFVVGWRRRSKIEVERLPARDQTRIVLSLRMGFGRYGASAATIEAADVMYNITV